MMIERSNRLTAMTEAVTKNSSAREMLILVDENDREVGTAEKLVVHIDGVLHRAFSIYLFNSKGQLLLTRRASSKYHSGGLWTNTCCSHPRPGESVDLAARRRLREETGIDCELRYGFQFIYRAELGGGLIEHELDHVFVGTYDGIPHLDPNEADACEWVDTQTLAHDIKARPERYSAWMALSLDRALACYRDRPATRGR
jgi:isopentenyl-diphosphate Delta-isomerase